ncbi:GntR family transcriptional regulator [Amphritea sp. 1_MG-2023]|uniref:GntR family transcriptional regulator n=1 Tax=Amphritea sp. 1_MG-2023 TaxID=3062670 RepID=UPI0026E3C126|nr:GntR family transcriptional regulator [Amphritea sp. 1_MG-2023]MDO6565172.1 GntR family transcriptional regulator [Amphritea sp. 1_MG-2023]
MTTADNLTKFLPLYAQVKQLLVQRLIDKTWTPGMGLPSENQLAAELKVSQGTVRKALDEMAAEKLVVRRQGRGTFVAEHTQEQALFHFFRLVDAEDQQKIPESEVLSLEVAEANELEVQRLGINSGDQVTRIERLRRLDGLPVIYEIISVALRLMPNVAEEARLPNSLYGLYQRDYGLSVLKAVERVRAVNASTPETTLLGIKSGTALLEIERTATSLDGQAIELRVSRCHTDKYRYMVELT